MRAKIMRIAAIQNISFGIVNPAIRDNIEKDISNGRAHWHPENNLRYLEDSDKFILKAAPEGRGYSLEYIDAPIVVHTGPIEHFLKFDPTDEQKYCSPKPLKNLYPNNFANTQFDKLNEGEDVEETQIYNIRRRVNLMG